MAQADALLAELVRDPTTSSPGGAFLHPPASLKAAHPVADVPEDRRRPAHCHIRSWSEKFWLTTPAALTELEEPNPAGGRKRVNLHCVLKLNVVPAGAAQHRIEVVKANASNGVAFRSNSTKLRSAYGPGFGNGLRAILQHGHSRDRAHARPASSVRSEHPGDAV